MSDSPDIFAAGGVEAPAAPAPSANQPYRVLARKYRPSSFAELIGQDAMVQTLGNAIRRDRLAHAFLMTGVRGVGKTTTARLIAKALNCIGEDGQGGPTIDPCGKCEPCQGIAEGSFIDVIEMDAASHTGVDDVREIIEAVRYSSVSARYKIYIIDEVHMLSKNAFNALLKTLEEPPAHVKFIFATTEVNKVPITVLSRCQRFDLKRIKADQLSAHFAHIVDKEGVKAEQEALDLIAQAAEGSVRDGLSILDQAIAHADMDGEGDGSGEVRAVQIREMLGLSDRGAIRRLFGQLLTGDSQALLDAVDEQYRIGVEPLSLMNGLLSLSHQVTLYKVGRTTDPTLSEEARSLLKDWSEGLSYPVLHRLWQLLLKGYQEVQQAHMPREACDMALLRVQCAADMPDPGKLRKMLDDMSDSGRIDAPPPMENTPASTSGEPAYAAQSEPSGQSQELSDPQSVATSGSEPDTQPGPEISEPEATKPDASPASFSGIVDLVGEVSVTKQSILKADIRLIEFAPPKIVYEAVRPISPADLNQISDILKQETGEIWSFEEGTGTPKPSLDEQAELEKQAAHQKILEMPMVKAAFEAFPDAKLLESAESSDQITEETQQPHQTRSSLA
ncbi:DNA polymerase-3 subunit gamma/tau [Parasphingorhabdus marina DSM 22363]|uniref:DNA polymerase III subunit gamma/tau n=1 Tax=Parasphingorhabdus marina DSM 22363 TaxID=1123272 RepID=A0A1N6FA31_9SPHN|nr:DNA polymerase III subunit gamma/tau [Parasphingorhabdus marina]SIN92084.1 DNA polymerase-3 subunit gamma/tau [Parasphingorhabdus marina DSM 22363]